MKGIIVLKFFTPVRGFFLFSCLSLFCISNTLAEKIPEVADSWSLKDDSELTQQIRTVFADVPVMVKIAKCESGLVHLKNGELIRNRDGSSARGVFQVLMRVHKPQMRKMGLNPEQTDQYLAYVRYLYDQNGLKALEGVRALLE